VAAPLRPPATKRLYDVSVLGGGLGGAAAGAILSRRGLRVLLVETGGAGPRAEAGWLLPRTPVLAPAARHLPAMEALLTELGLQIEATRSQEALAPDLQLVTPRHRLELAREPAALAAELRREWPAEADRLGQALAALARSSEAAAHLLRAAPPLPPAGFFDRLVLRRMLRAAARASGARADARVLEAVADHPVGAALLALPAFLGRLDGPVSGLTQARLCGTALRGLQRPSGGASSLDEALRRRVADARGELLGTPAEPVRLEALATEGGRLTTLRLAGSPDVYMARAFVLTAPLAWLLPLVPDGLAGPGGPRQGRVKPGRRLASLHLVVRPAALPPGLGPAALFLAEGAGAGEAVLLEVAAARHEGRPGPSAAAGGERLVSLWTPAAPGSGPDGTATTRLETALAQLLPFHARHLVHRSAPLPAPHLLQIDEPTLGVAGPLPRSPWKNLLLGGPDLLPGLGLEGEIHAALQAAAQATALLGVMDRSR
jgi:phytoene dehydrogenase-like protein